MKKGFLFFAGAAFVLALGFTSCKKDYTCDCTIVGVTTSAAINDAKKKDAQDACDALETAAKIGDPAASCTLK